MKLFTCLVLFFTLFTLHTFAQPANDNCSNATALTVNAPCIAGTTDAGTVQVAEVTTAGCAAGVFTQTVWYRFTATSSHMYVQLYLTSFGGSGATWGPGYWTSVIYQTSSCIPSAGSIVSCRSCNSQGTADGIIVNEMFGLTVGATYYIQIGYRTGMGINLVPNYCINVSDIFTPDCNTCANPCGPACGFTTQPTAAQVTANCPSYPQMQYNEGAVTDTQCYTFNAVNDTADFQVILNSTCGAGNVTNFTWSLYQFGNCGAGPIQTGNITNLKFTGLTIGAGYVFCYTFTVPAGCYHTAYWPYFIGATPLPVELLSFTGEGNNDRVALRWVTASEINNDHFTLQRSGDEKEFTTIGKVEGAGNSTSANHYLYYDIEPLQGINYYRLQQTDFDGHTTTFPIVALRFDRDRTEFFPNPVSDLSQVAYFSDMNKVIRLKIFDARGQLISEREEQVFKGDNAIKVDLASLSRGIYFLQIGDDNLTDHLRFTKN
jgi:hypothetical protein